jgi:hypothetical protein
MATPAERRRAWAPGPLAALRARVRRTVLGTPGTIAGTVYGTIVVMGAMTAGSTGGLDIGRMAAVVVTTVIVLWLAHVYAHALGEALERGKRMDRAEVASVARRELAIPLAAVAPTVCLVLGALGVLKETRAVWLAMGIGLLALAVQGVRYARLEDLGPRGTAVSVGLNLSLGLVIVVLKAVVAH